MAENRNPRTILARMRKTRRKLAAKAQFSTTKLLPSDPNFQHPTDLFGNPLNVDLFGNVIEEKPKRKK